MNKRSSIHDRRARAGRLAWFLALLVGVLLLRQVSAQGATITVDSAADAGGICPGELCTLRQAILTAISGDTINFASGINTITLTSAELLIDKSLTISGPGANLLTIQRSSASGTPFFRIFEIGSGNLNVTISGLTISKGNAGGDGDGIYNGSGTLTVAGCTISGNIDDGQGCCGGGIGCFGCGAGGGIFNSTGTINVNSSTISGNFAGENSNGGGGGIFNSTGGTVNILNSTLSGNNGSGFTSSAAHGGGIKNAGTVTITTSTIYGNTGGAFGGGIYNTGTVTITNGTISGNTAGTSGGGIQNGGTVTAKSTIIAKNTLTGQQSGSADLNGTLSSQGYNLIGTTNGANITGTTTGDLYNVDPMLGPLQDNGGPTFTQALLSGSPAIDRGLSSGDPDQRGLPRPVDDPSIPNATGGDGTDTGAFEVQTISTPTPTPTPSPTPTPTATPIPPATSLNMSTRSLVQTGDNVMIGGFIVTGNAPKKVIVRALGPSLQKSGLTGVLADPILELHGPNGSLIASDDNWRDNPDQALQIQASGIPPQNDLESAIVASLPPAGYTAIVSGKSNGTGLGLVEVYDLDQNSSSKLANMSTRARVETGNNVVIGGFILGGNNGSPQIIVRAIGPSLAQLGINNPLADPTLELRDGNGMLLAFDNDWRDNPAQATQISAAGLAPRNDLEAAIAMTLPPGTYTAIVAGRSGGTGIGLVEIYNLQ
jgi:hypothetical protein